MAIAALAAVVWNAQPIVLAGIHTYRQIFSPLAARIGIRCRFTPTCSRYAETVVQRDGVIRGGRKALARIVRCNPWSTPIGTRDDP